MVSNSHFHLSVIFHYEDIDDSIIKSEFNDDKIISTVYDKDLSYMSLFCGMQLYEYQLRKYLNKPKITIDSEEFNRSSLIFCLTNLGDLMIYNFINRRETDPKFLKEQKIANITSGSFKRSLNVNPNNSEKDSNRQQQNKNEEKEVINNKVVNKGFNINFNEINLNDQNKIKANDNKINLNNENLKSNPLNIQTNSNNEFSLFQNNINQTNLEKELLQAKLNVMKIEAKLNQNPNIFQEAKNRNLEEVRTSREENIQIDKLGKESRENNKIATEYLINRIDDYMKLALESYLKPITKDINNKMKEMDSEFECNISLKNYKEELEKLCHSLKKSFIKIMKEEEYDELNRQVIRTIKHYQDAEKIYREYENKTISEKEINDYIENNTKHEKIKKIMEKFKINYEKLKKIILNYNDLLIELKDKLKELDFSYIDEQLKVTKKYESCYSKFKKIDPFSTLTITVSLLEKFSKICESLKKNQDDIKKRVEKLKRNKINLTSKGFSVNFSEDIEKIYHLEKNNQAIFEPFHNQNQYLKINEKVTKILNTSQGSINIFNDYNADCNIEDFFKNKKKQKLNIHTINKEEKIKNNIGKIDQIVSKLEQDKFNESKKSEIKQIEEAFVEKSKIINNIQTKTDVSTFMNVLNSNLKKKGKIL